MEKSKTALEQAIEQIPEAGWRFASDRREYLEIAQTMRLYGVPEDDIIYLLHKAYWAAASAYLTY